MCSPFALCYNRASGIDLSELLSYLENMALEKIAQGKGLCTTASPPPSAPASTYPQGSVVLIRKMKHLK